MYLEFVLALIPVAEMVAISYLLWKLKQCRKEARECQLELEICDEHLWK